MIWMSSGWRALASALLDGFQIRNDGTDIAGVKLEFGHIRVARHDALTQSFFQGFNRIAPTERAERRSKVARALARPPNGVTRSATARKELFAALEILSGGISMRRDQRYRNGRGQDRKVLYAAGRISPRPMASC